MNHDDVIGQLSSVKYLYLRHLSEPKDNSLRMIVEEAIENRLGVIRPQHELAAVPELAHIPRDSWAIESIDGCRKFELYWKAYIAYLVTEEMVASCGSYGDEVYKGILFRTYEKSHFLEHLVREHRRAPRSGQALQNCLPEPCNRCGGVHQP